MTSAMPPLPPDIRAQQMQPAQSPMMQFAAAMGGPGQDMREPEPSFDPKAFVKERMVGVAEQLKDVARIVVQKQPALMPYLQAMLEAGSQLMKAVDESAQGAANGNPVPPEPRAAVGFPVEG